MIYKIFFFSFIYFWSVSYGQNAIGFIDNYSGIQSVSFNPANIVDSFYKTDINVFSVNINVGNDTWAFKPFKILQDVVLNKKKSTNIDDYLNNTNNSSASSNFYVNSTILGPSILWSKNRKQSFALTTGIRVSGSIFDTNNINLYKNDPSKLLGLDFEYLKSPGTVYSWVELGFTYANVIKQNISETFKVGLTLKILKGLQMFSVSVTDEIKSIVNYAPLNPSDTSVTLDGKINISSSTMNIDYGQAIDIGVVYEKRNKTLAVNMLDEQGIYYSKAPYQYKLSVAITDIGFLTFDKIKTKKIDNLDFNSLIDYINLKDSEDFSKETFLLPTTVHLNIDYNLKPHWFVNANMDVYLLSSKNYKNIKSVSNLTISPRYESLRFSVFMPLSINRFGIFKTGLGFRKGYFFVGSSSLITNNLILSKEVDFFIGVKIPIYNKKLIKEFKQTFKNYYLD